MSTAWIRVAYGVVLGLVLLFTVAFGSAMAFPGPDLPENPDVTFRQLTAGGENDRSQNQLTASIDKFYGEAAEYRDEYVSYQRNTFLLGAGLAALLAMIGLLLPAAVNYLRWGFLTGAALALVWAGWVALGAVPNPAPSASSVLQLLAAHQPEPLDFAGRFLRFAVSFVSLIVLLFLGLWRLTEWPSPGRRVASAPVAATPVIGPPVAWAPPPQPAPSPPTTLSAADTLVPNPSPPRPEFPPPPEPHNAGAPPLSVSPSTPAETIRITTDPPPAPAVEAAPWQRPGEGGVAPRPDTPA